MTTEQRALPEVTRVRKAIRITMLFGLLAAGLTTTACQDTNLYTGVDSNGGWNGPTSRTFSGGGGITGYPF
ncbi:MAG: hypothetical protein LJF30_14315 [Acidobacteria bacterium]|jgi:hypothetical protein|nr:hypothetical protein [Acidobacteriota bacterium]